MNHENNKAEQERHESMPVRAWDKKSEDQGNDHASKRDTSQILISSIISTRMEWYQKRADGDEQVSHPFG